ncbi:hypothetical protein [Pontibacter roseus]|uniref:hypothetical protein n=1 Tax=Pontibacter roseus TaxID=336989 RepID=UPI0003795311|nr:hypothetical protein [Pontibacter roseus]
MLRFLHLLLALVLFSQCKPDDTGLNTETAQEAGDARFGQEVLLQHLEQVTLYGGNVPRRLIVSVASMQDSRCPVTADCATLGRATVTLRASNNQGTTENITLCLGDCSSSAPRDTHAVTALVGEVNYRFTLKEVMQYPGLEKPGEAKKARIMVEKL